jgi:hypothetical protein
MFWSKKTPTLDSLQMTAHDWALAEASEFHRTCVVDASTAVMPRFHDQPAPSSESFYRRRSGWIRA